ncbi:Pogo transposable element with KRAB domainlike [Phytophthora cinnamomi]|uniref:Pogo transposable element with KRAB domainlike n=1 Tax=Phytophthora cinnamomi TaxID=4785 RepID=UPI00355ABF25|nr:Pogo transposable element with KRAB domainlike [Phytophthora cinnamomi]
MLWAVAFTAHHDFRYGPVRQNQAYAQIAQVCPGGPTSSSKWKKRVRGCQQCLAAGRCALDVAGLLPTVTVANAIANSIKVNSYLDWHVAKHDVYGEQFCTSWEAADEDHEDMDDFNLDELHDALDDAALIDE